MSYYTLLSLGQTIGSLVALSGYCPPFADAQIEKIKDVPVFAYHGESDPMVPQTFHKLGLEKMKKAGMVNIKYLTERNL